MNNINMPGFLYLLDVTLLQHVEFFNDNNNNNKNERREENEEDRVNDTEECCVVCFDVMVPGTDANMPCRHCFHADCIARWLVKSDDCPFCRRSLRLSLTNFLHACVILIVFADLYVIKYCKICNTNIMFGFKSRRKKEGKESKTERPLF